MSDLSISGARDFVFIKTNFVTMDFSKAKVKVNFKGGVLKSADGIIYQSTTDDFDLDDPTFIKSYY